MQKNIIITGVSRGIGLELVKILAKNNSILALSRNINLVKNIPNVSSLSINLTQMDSLVKISDFIQKKWGKVDIIIHNAGKLVNKAFEDTTMQDFIEIYQVNVFGVAALTQQVLPFLKEGSHVVTISSMGGVQGSAKFAGLSAYSSSKGALITLTELLAEEYKEKGISFNTLALGAVQTEMLSEAFPDYKASCTAVEMAEYIAQFAVIGNQYYNGKILPVAKSTP